MTGKPKDYLKLTADSGTRPIQAFCPECGSPIYSTSPGEGVQDAYRVRVGILQYLSRGGFSRGNDDLHRRG